MDLLGLWLVPDSQVGWQRSDSEQNGSDLAGRRQEVHDLVLLGHFAWPAVGAGGHALLDLLLLVQGALDGLVILAKYILDLDVGTHLVDFLLVYLADWRHLLGDALVDGWVQGCARVQTRLNHLDATRGADSCLTLLLDCVLLVHAAEVRVVQGLLAHAAYRALCIADLRDDVGAQWPLLVLRSLRDRSGRPGQLGDKGRLLAACRGAAVQRRCRARRLRRHLLDDLLRLLRGSELSGQGCGGLT